MKHKYSLLIFVFLIGCTKNMEKVQTTAYRQIKLFLENTTPTVDIRECILISNNLLDSLEAIELLKVKRQLPLAMQQKDSLLFEMILAKNFTFTADSTEFFNRRQYINDRVNGTWTIDTVRYNNLTLQFIDSDKALLTYRNVLKGTDNAGNPDFEYYTWADVFCKENGKWKYLTVHNIDARIEYLSDTIN